MAQELSGVIGDRDSGGQSVTRGLRGGDPDHRAQPGAGPGAAQFGRDPGLARPGRGIDDRDAPAVGQDGHGRGGLVFAQPGLRARAWRGVRVAG